MTERYPGQESENISLWFVPTQTPEGGAPDEIRDQWVGVPLPVRQKNVANEDDTVGGYKVGADIFDPTKVHVGDVMETVTVVSEDAITALRAAEHSEAADWWEMYMGGKHWMFGNNLMFRASEGRILNPDEVEQEVPGTCERFNRLFSEIETTDDEDDIVF